MAAKRERKKFFFHQEAAFLTIAHQVLQVELYRRKIIKSPPTQMIFYLGGEGGTGKSKVVKALSQYMSELGISSRLRKAAPTGVAAGNIGGSTLHMLLGLAVKKKGRKKDKTSEVSDKVVRNFKDVDVFLIDEISMSGCAQLQKVSTRLSDAKNNIEPFGGLTTILCGDFYQLPPNSNDALFRRPRVERNISLTNATKGFIKFCGVTHCIFLQTQHRIRDEEYKAVVTRFRHGEQLEADEDYMKSKIITKSNNMQKGHLHSLAHDPTIIVKNNDLRFHLNFQKAKQVAKSTGKKLLINIARDVCSNRPLDTSMRSKLLQKPDGARTNYGAGLLPMFPGMPVMIKCNMGPELSVSNGSCGVIHSITLDPRENVDFSNTDPHYLRFPPVAVYIKMDVEPDADGQTPTIFMMDGLPKNVIGTTIEHVKRPMVFEHKEKGIVGTLKITRRQFWFLPAYAITVNSSQGRTMKCAVIHLDGEYSTNEKPYVMMSRLTNGDGLGIIGTWDKHLFELEPNPIMINYIKTRLLPKDKDTRNALPVVKCQLQKLHMLLTKKD